jgi:hypothetical protein
MIRRWWRSIRANSPEALRRDLRNVLAELTELDTERDRLAERRDRLTIELAAMETPRKQRGNVVQLYRGRG